MTEDARQRGVSFALVVISMATLCAQILMVRIFSYAMNHGFVYMAVSLAMVGFGISGTLIALIPSLRRIRTRSILAFCNVAFALTLVGSMKWFAHASDTANPDQGMSLLSPLALRLLPLAIPFACAGLGIGLTLMESTEKLNSRYAWNLMGSGIGCLVAYPLLVQAGADGGLLCVAGCLLFAACTLLKSFGRIAMAFAALICFVLVPVANGLFKFQPDAADQLSDLIRQIDKAGEDVEGIREEFSAWDPVGRIEVHSLPGDFGRMNHEAPLRFYSQDAGAGSVLLSLDEHPRLRHCLANGTLYGLAAQLRPEADALVIGIGGAPDILGLLAGGAKTIDAVEINGATCRMIEENQRDFLGFGDALQSGRLRIHHADGRGFARQRAGSYDIIQMTGADTYAANPAGASILAEGYLYTKEAIHDLLGALKSGGVLAITRFGIESARVFNTAFHALSEAGIEEPARHLMVVAQGEGDLWSTTFVAKDPVTHLDLKRIRSSCRKGRALSAECLIPTYNVLGFRFDAPMRLAFQADPSVDLAAERKKSEGDRWDFSPVSDDRPFFFQFQKREGIDWKKVWSTSGFSKHHWDLPDYLRIAIQVSVIALLLILIPLLKLGFSNVRFAEAIPAGLNFFALGAGFMFLEVVLMQRCALFLGHPNHAITIVLFSILVFSGFGSWISGKLPLPKIARFVAAVIGVSVWTLLFIESSQEWFSERMALSLVERSLSLMIWLAPLGLLLGMPFPAALGILEEQNSSLTPWAWGINSFASVCASLAAIPLAMEQGFAFSLNVAMASYVVAMIALIVFIGLMRRRLAA